MNNMLKIIIFFILMMITIMFTMMVLYVSENYVTL
jgi:hypothetical protein